MSLEFHTVEGLTPFSMGDRVRLGVLTNQANAAGGSAGAAVTAAISGLTLPANYAVVVQPGQDATWYVSGKTNTGFTVHLAPRLAATTLAAGTFDAVIVA